MDINFWAYEKFADLVRCRPADAFETIMEILVCTDCEDVLNNRAAGPLEDLVRMHGEQFIDQIEAEAQRDRRFKSLLGGLWRVGAPNVWARIEKIQPDD